MPGIDNLREVAERETDDPLRLPAFLEVFCRVSSLMLDVVSGRGFEGVWAAAIAAWLPICCSDLRLRIPGRIGLAACQRGRKWEIDR